MDYCKKILYGILSMGPDLFPQTCPNRLKQVIEDQYSKDRVPLASSRSPDEHSEAFELLSYISALSIKVCLLVDGLDDFDGDHHRLCQVAISLLASPLFKMCVSSRQFLSFGSTLARIKVESFKSMTSLPMTSKSLQKESFQLILLESRWRENNGKATTDFDR